MRHIDQDVSGMFPSDRCTLRIRQFDVGLMPPRSMDIRVHAATVRTAGCATLIFGVVFHYSPLLRLFNTFLSHTTFTEEGVRIHGTICSSEMKFTETDAVVPA